MNSTELTLKNIPAEEERPTPSPKNFSEDLKAILISFSIVLLVIGLWSFFNIEMQAIKFKTWVNPEVLFNQIFDLSVFGKWIFTGLLLAVILGFSQKSSKKDSLRFFLSFLLLYTIGTVVYLLSAQTTMHNYLEYAFWALLLGLLIQNLLTVPSILKPALKSEFYIKIGLVLMGAEVLFSNIASFGIYGIGISWIVVPIVLVFMWFFGTKVLKMKDTGLIMVIAVATAVCGVSAAIAASAAIKAKKNNLTFAVSLCILFTIVMMILMPIAVNFLDLGELIGGAWIGNTVDSTGAVVLAGEAVGPLASQVAAMIKMIQNVLIGVVAFVIAVFFAKREGTEETTSAKEIWSRLPKFILGFLGLSLIFSFIIQPLYGIDDTNKLISILGSWKSWFFCLTFLCIGLETDFKKLVKDMDGGSPITLYIAGQSFSIVLSLIVCWFFLSGHFLSLPEITVLGG
ncbi:MAG: putative sulfate exporter family transporter [Gallicola sp.]|nr:putative sulfate exporter family transporter [Gallicola sp.]